MKFTCQKALVFFVFKLNMCTRKEVADVFSCSSEVFFFSNNVHRAARSTPSPEPDMTRVVWGAVPSPRGGILGAYPPKGSSKPPTNETWNTIDQLRLCQFLECQAPPHKRKTPRIENFLATVLVGGAWLAHISVFYHRLVRVWLKLVRV